MTDHERELDKEIDGLVDEHLSASSNVERADLRDRLLIVLVRAVKVLLFDVHALTSDMASIKKEFDGDSKGLLWVLRWVRIRARVELFFLSGVGLYLTWKILPAFVKLITRWIGEI